MSWLDKLNIPQQPVQKQPPGAWWQQGTQYQERPAQQPVNVNGNYSHTNYQPPPTHDYRPDSAESMEMERCPRCNSENYAPIRVDLSMGGSSYGGGAALQAVGGKLNQCFDCRYPHYNATGDIIRSGNGVSAGNIKNMQTLRPRQFGDPTQGSCELPSLFDNAPLIL